MSSLRAVVSPCLRTPQLRRVAAVLIAGLGVGLGAEVCAATMSLDRHALNIGLVNSGGTPTSITPDQTVALTAPGIAWTAASDKAFVTVTPASGNGATLLTIKAVAGTGLPLTGRAPLATITVTAAGGVSAPQTLTVDVRAYAPGTTTGPFGFFDTPVNGAIGVAGAVGVTGWALDDIGVASVKLYRDPVLRETGGANGKIYIGDAVFVSGVRPDLDTANPTAPLGYQAGWGYRLLTNLLPDLAKGTPAGGNGIFTLYAYAADWEGHQTFLGATTFTANNAQATKPFGTIDTPAQGERVSGTIANFGWVLTPLAGKIPTDGSTIRLFLDGVAQPGAAAYNFYRSDIATLFPGYDNTNGAVGAFTIDTTTLANGVHTIAWLATDDLARADGIGSRYFTVFNQAPTTTATSRPTSTATPRATATATSTPTPTATSGFTAIIPSADSRLIYVSSSLGSDTNTCLAPGVPCKSIDAGLGKMRAGYPDHVYLKRGDVWRDQGLSNVQSGRSPTEPAVVAFYGSSGSRPTLEDDDSLFQVGNILYVKKNLNIIGLHFYAYKMDPQNPSFTGLDTDTADISLISSNENILFEDNVFDFIGLAIQAWQGGIPRNFTFRRNIWTGAWANQTSYNQDQRPSNMYVNDADGLLIEENVIDNGGWNATVTGAGASMYCHNLYIQYGNVGNTVVVRKNIITRASSHGIHGRPGGLYQDNFFGRNAVGLQMGYDGHPLALGTKAYALDNVITEGRSMVQGIDPCQGANLCTPAVWSLVTADRGAGDFKIAGNIAHSQAVGDDRWKLFFSSLSFASESDLTVGWAQGAVNQGRTLGDYNASLGGTNSFDDFMKRVISRPLQTWDARDSANAINNYVRQGFGLPAK